MFTARKTPRQQRSRETVEVVLEGAAQVFDREGITATTNRIAERAGVSIGTVYQYFPNKEALLLALADRHLTTMREQLTAAFNEIEDRHCGWDQAAELIARAVAEAHTERPALHRVLHAYTPREPRAVARYDDVLAEAAGRLADLLRRTQQGGDDPRQVATMIVHAIDAQLHRVLLGDDPEDPDDLAGELTQALLAHLPGRPGRADARWPS